MTPWLRERFPFALRVGLRRAAPTLLWPLRPRLPRASEALPHAVAERATPLHRQNASYEADLQAAKEQNLRRVAELLDGLILPPGGTFSWHAEVGPPLRARGFAEGPELQDGRLGRGGGGGACQASNLLFWLALRAGLEVVERHRHGLDLFPDDARDLPFGCGATVYFPHRDLVLRNPHPFALRLSLTVEGGMLRGALSSAEALPGAWSIREEGHRFVKDGGLWFRENRLFRDGPQGSELIAAHRARVCYAFEETRRCS